MGRARKQKVTVKVILSNSRLQIMGEKKGFCLFFFSFHTQVSKCTCTGSFYFNHFMSTGVYVCVLHLHYSPLLAVLAHAHSPAVAWGRVAAGALTHLKANATGGAAGRPGSPGSPRSISMVTDKAMSVCDSNR